MQSRITAVHDEQEAEVIQSVSIERHSHSAPAPHDSARELWLIASSSMAGFLGEGHAKQT